MNKIGADTIYALRKTLNIFCKMNADFADVSNAD
jgi:hypothetical protein